MDKDQPFHRIQADAYRRHHPATAELDLKIRELSSLGKTAVQIAMELPCSESTVYRALRRVQNFRSSQHFERFLQSLRESLDQNPSNCAGNVQSVMERLYTAYANSKECEPEECRDAILALEDILSDFPVRISKAIRKKVEPICDCYERHGFTEGFKIGFHMSNEISV